MSVLVDKAVIMSNPIIFNAELNVQSVTAAESLYPDTYSDLKVENAGETETAAGKFDDVIKITFDVTVPRKTDPRSEVGFQWPKLASRQGKKEYWFARGSGIVKCVNYLKGRAVVANYELISYEGTGEGYMPVQDGLTRSYEAMGLTDDMPVKQNTISAIKTVK